MKKIIQRGEEMNITIETIHSDSILYFLTNNKGNTILSETLKVKEGNTASVLLQKIQKNWAQVQVISRYLQFQIQF